MFTKILNKTVSNPNHSIAQYETTMLAHRFRETARTPRPTPEVIYRAYMWL